MIDIELTGKNVQIVHTTEVDVKVDVHQPKPLNFWLRLLVAYLFVNAALTVLLMYNSHTVFASLGWLACATLSAAWGIEILEKRRA